MSAAGAWPHTGAILAGGLSRRMGTPKQNLRITAPGGEEMRMIDAVASVMREVCCDVVILGECETLPDLRRIADLRTGHGPLGGIEALLASGIDSQYLICPCDTPCITADVLRALTANDSLATVLKCDDAASCEPLPARIGADALPTVRRLLDEGRRSVHGLMRTLNARGVVIPASFRVQLRNVNTPAEVRSLHE